MLGRSLSDEEKSASLKIEDDYSTEFESALEKVGDDELEKSYTLEFADARSRFVQSQLESDSGNEEEAPELPQSKPPTERRDDSGFPSKELYASANSDRVESASAELEKTHNFVTKDDEGSLVRARMRLFEKNSSVEQVSDSAEVIQVAEDTPDSVVVIEDSVISISDTSGETKKEEEKEYPDDLNPFGDDDEDEETSSPPNKSTHYDSSLNPFGSEDDDDGGGLPVPSPKPRIKKKVKPLPEDRQLPNPLQIQKISTNPFEDDDDEEEEEESQKRVVPAHRITLTPYWNESPEVKPVPLPRSLR